jgi:hypothetical protein
MVESIITTMEEFFRNDAARLLLSNLEYIVAGSGAAGAVLFFKARKYKSTSNDLTPMMVKLKRRQDALNKHSKGMM